MMNLSSWNLISASKCNIILILSCDFADYAKYVRRQQKNVQIRLQESRIMVTVWNEGAVEPINSYTTSSSTTQNACLRRCQQYFCNFLLACLVIYFLFILHSFNAKK